MDYRPTNPAQPLPLAEPVPCIVCRALCGKPGVRTTHPSHICDRHFRVPGERTIYRIDSLLRRLHVKPRPLHYLGARPNRRR